MANNKRKDIERLERHRGHVSKVLTDFGLSVDNDHIKVYVPTSNKGTDIGFLIISDGTGIIYTDYRQGLGLRVSVPMVDIRTGNLVTTMLGKFDQESCSYRQTPAERERIPIIMGTFHDGNIYKGLPFYNPRRSRLFQDWAEYYRTASQLHDLTPIREYVKEGPADAPDETSAPWEEDCTQN